MIQCYRGWHFLNFFFLTPFWELKVQRSRNESILLLWCPAKWTSCIPSQWSTGTGGLSIISMIYRMLSMCGTCPALHTQDFPHTGAEQHFSPQGKAARGWELEIKTWKQSSFSETFCPLSFICSTWWPCSDLCALSPPKQFMTQFHHHK